MPPALAVALAATLLAAAPAGASTTQEAMFQDDAELVYPARAQVARTLDTLQALGVDRVRVSVYWRLVAPNPESERRPDFSGGGQADPAAYPRQNWKRYDDLVRLAHDRGIQINFNIGGPAPDWASGGKGGIVNPSPGDFGLFTWAVATRYSGTYEPPPGQQNPPPPPPRNPNPLPVEIGGVQPSQSEPARAAEAREPVLPRISYWSLFNEPNQRVFMSPQYVNRHEWSPRQYRALVDNAFDALVKTGHGGDTILVGETAPKGGGERDDEANMRPLRFIRALYCVDKRLRPLRGRTAEALGCPTSNQVAEFPRRHPGLFQSSGFAHHPYSLLTPPWLRSKNPDDVGMADLGRLTGTLGRIFSRYRQRNRLPIYNTEFGYQSKPPDPFGFPQYLQATYINQAEYMGYVNPRVRSAHQFLLVDAPPYTQYPSNSYQYWSSFQTGLMERGGDVKQAFGAYRMPIYIPGARRKRPGTFRVWGAARPAPNGSAQRVRVQYRSFARRARWRTIKTVTTRNLRNYVDTRVRITRTGVVRLAWRGPAGLITSRPAPVTITR
ncbi:MAG: hypothetical protein M3141_01775 [Actinomycetota bacterium]|nr:hypothetical protein [Actinomycetota bacterium]